MIKFFVRLLFIVVSAVVLQSCSVDKRVHFRGYHVEWFGKKKSPLPVEAIAEKETAAIIQREQENESIECPILNDRAANDLEVSKEQKTLDLSASKEPFSVTDSKRSLSAQVKRSEKKFEVFSLSSTALVIVAFVVPVELILFVFLAAFIAGVIGLIRVLKHRDRFRGLMFAIIGVAVSLLMFVGLIVALSMFT